MTILPIPGSAFLVPANGIGELRMAPAADGCKRALDPDLGFPPKNELFVSDIYVRRPYVVDSAMRLDDVLEHMAAQHIGSALVTKHGRLVGIFTAMDACRLYGEHLRKLAPPRCGNEVA